MVLDFEPEAVGPEQPGEPLRARLRLLVIPLAQVQGDLAGQAGGEADEPLVMPLQRLAIDPRAAVVALEESEGAELDEVGIAGAVRGEALEWSRPDSAEM